MDPIATIGGTTIAPGTTSPITTTPPPAELAEAGSNAALDKDAFLKLLVAQLKYQDPTAPTDVSQMMAQTSQLSMVERLDQIAEGIEILGGGGPLASAASMLGREVTFDIGASEPFTATVDSVRLVDGATVLTAGGYDVPLDALIAIRTLSSSTPDPTGTGATGDDHDHDHDDSTSTGTTTDSSEAALV